MRKRSENPSEHALYLRDYHARKPGYRAKLNKEWIEKNRERYNQAKSEYRFRLKLEAIDHYSNGTRSCARCGFASDVDALQLDHIEDNGAAHRKELGIAGRGIGAGTTMYERLRALGWMPGLQVLCANCNTIKALRVKRGTTSAEMFVAISRPMRWRAKA